LWLENSDGVALLTFDGHRGDDNNIYVFATNDYGEAGKAIRNGILIRPEACMWFASIRGTPTSCLQDRVGLWVSWDRGANWTALKIFPRVPVDRPSKSRLAKTTWCSPRTGARSGFLTI